jgi:protein phosphatase
MLASALHSLLACTRCNQFFSEARGKKLRLDVGARTSVGRVRENNEDAYLVSEPDGLFIVSDGMGGEAHGEVASALTVKTIAEHCKAAIADPTTTLVGAELPDISAHANRLASAVRAANLAIFQAGSADVAQHGMGATVVSAWLNNSSLSVAHVGDSRIYLLHAGELQQITADHSLVAEQVRHGLLTPAQAAVSTFQNVLTRALGPREEAKVDAADHKIVSGDVLLLCSDGVTRMVSDAELAAKLSSPPTAQQAADELIALADERGGTDNSTVVVVRVL